MKITSQLVRKRIMFNDDGTTEICAYINNHNSFWGWINDWNMTKSSWEFIGKQMGWSTNQEFDYSDSIKNPGIRVSIDQSKYCSCGKESECHKEK